MAEFVPDAAITCRDHPIGCIGAGMIVAECHLPAYAKAGFEVVAIASRHEANARQLAERYGIGRVFATPHALIGESGAAVIDIAVPPSAQPELIRLALRTPHVRAVLAQKPLALDLATALQLRDEAARSGKIVAVNQNMRHDQAMRVAKQLVDRGALGEVVLAQIDMHAIPHWQSFLEGYDRLTIANMAIHHLDIMRYLLGEPIEITTQARSDPRTTFAHRDGITLSTLRFPSGAMGVTLEDVWSGRRAPSFANDQHIAWRITGTEGLAKGTIGWPKGEASTLTYASMRETDGAWVSPQWQTRWFPDAFAGVMGEVQAAIATGEEPSLSIADNVRTMALVEAAYRSLEERRPVPLAEFAV